MLVTVVAFTEAFALVLALALAVVEPDADELAVADEPPQAVRAREAAAMATRPVRTFTRR